MDRKVDPQFYFSNVRLSQALFSVSPALSAYEGLVLIISDFPNYT